MTKIRTFALLICDDKDFLCEDNKVVKIECSNHEEAMGYFISIYGEDLNGLTIGTFCFEDEARKYGYKFSTGVK